MKANVKRELQAKGLGIDPMYAGYIYGWRFRIGKKSYFVYDPNSTVYDSPVWEALKIFLKE